MPQDRGRSQAQRERRRRDLEAPRAAHRHITKQSQRLPPGKKRLQCNIVKAYDPTIAPLLKGKSNCPAQFGRQTGILSAPASGFLFAHRGPAGNPRDPSSVLPLLDKGHHAMHLVPSPHHLRGHSLGGDLGSQDAELRQALHARGMLTVGIPP